MFFPTLITEVKKIYDQLRISEKKEMIELQSRKFEYHKLQLILYIGFFQPFLSRGTHTKS